ncbi:MAG: DUF983 domain-containing protein [Cytophagales bacterium]|nr:DUF983 domain-containing protein [Cytophagales bacterium]
MIGKGSRLYSMIFHKCPRCHEGDLFSSGAYNMKHFIEMPEKCSHCDQRFMLEPYFYSGAMYVSYALQVALFTTVYVALRVLFNPPMEVYMITTIVAAFLLFPVTMRLSRSIYINFFVSYDKSFHKKAG